jgi:hypothetical protein
MVGKRGKPHALVVCPIYQLPARSSQIYQQAITRDVCIFTYSHLAVIVKLAETEGKKGAERTLLASLKSVSALNPSKDSAAYWTAINTSMLGSHKAVSPLWKAEKIAALESISVAKEEALIEIARERQRILGMSRQQAVKELIERANLDSRERVVRSVSDSGIMNLV